MKKKYKIVFLFLVFLTGNQLLRAQKNLPQSVKVGKAIAETENATDAYINYTENKGQWYNKVLYQGDFQGGRIFLEKDAFTYVFTPSGWEERLHPGPNTKREDLRYCVMTFQAVRMQFLNTMPAAIEGGEQRSYYSNYFLGNDKSKWASRARSFGEVNYNNLYPGISVKVFSDMRNVRYDFTVDPHTSASQIKMKFAGQNSLSLSNNQLVIHTEIGDIAQARPIAYQYINGRKVNVDCDFVLNNDEVSFAIKGNYDANEPLIIDPTLVFSTFTGSTADNWGMSATYDAYSNAYTSGICFAIGYPTSPGAFQMTFQGGGTGGGNNWPAPDNTGFDIVVSKFNPTGSKLLYSTYLGGSDNEQPMSLVVDNNNNLLVLGHTYSTNFPTTPGAFQTSNQGGADIIISKFDTSGTQLLVSTYVGGSGDDGVNISDLEDSLGSLKYNYADNGRADIVVDNNNNVYVASCTKSTNFPVTAGALQGGPQGQQDGCAFEMNMNLSAMVWSTYLGGSGDDAAYNIALNSTNEAYVVGGTASSNFPTTAGTIQPTYSGNIDGFLVHLSQTGKLLQSTFLGTAGYDQAYFVQTDKYNLVYVCGQTSGNYPITKGVYSNANSGQFIHGLTGNLGKTLFSTEFGSGRGVPDIAPSAFLVDRCLNIYVSGWGGRLYGYNRATSSTVGLPTTPGAFRTTPNIVNGFGYSNNGEDFYFMVLDNYADSLLYATYFGSTGGANGSMAHVDGGTSRFDKRGAIYQAICGGCGGYSDIPTTPTAWSKTNDGPNCNNALVKFQMDLYQTVASFVLAPAVPVGCAPFKVTFNNTTSNGQHFQWQFGDGSTSTVQSPTYTYTKPGTYTIMLIGVDSTTCNQVDTSYGTIRVVAPPKLVAPSAFVCLGDSVTLTSKASDSCSYVWSPFNMVSSVATPNTKVAPLGNTNFYITVHDSFCTVTDTVNVQVFHNVTVVIPDSAKLCVGDSIKLTTDSSYVKYAWSTGSANPFIEVKAGGSYSVATVDKHGCKGQDSVTVIPYKKVPLTKFDTVICLGHKVDLYADSGDYKYFWAPPFGLNKTNIFDPVARPLSTTTYTVTVTNGPCISVDSSRILVKPLPLVKTDPDSVMALPGQVVSLLVTGTPPFLWTPSSELSCNDCASPTYKADSNRVFYVSVADSDGCSAMDSVMVDVIPTIYIPDAFTPNGDGLNDVFRPKFTGYSSIQVYIFDRWGQLIYQWNTLDGGWDGTVNGHKVEEDTYVYMIKAVSYLHKPYQAIGNVTVIR